MVEDPLKQLPPELLARAVPGAEGCAEMAWSRLDAVAVLSCLVGSSIATLGGDVLRRSGDRTVPAYANWSCNRHAAEPWTAYVERSYREAEDYLRKFPDPEDGSIVYVLVCSNSERSDRSVTE
jgi:hypothetical protein